MAQRTAGAARRGRAQADDSSRDDLLAEVASLYYQQRLDQEEIAGRLSVSRSTVSRMLSEALDRGIVEIRIKRSLPVSADLQRSLIQVLGLRDALVLDTNGRGGYSLGRAGRLAARYLDTTLSDGDVLAISWGTGVRAVADGLEVRTQRHVEVIQMLGGAGTRDPGVDGPELARRLAHQFGGQCRYLNAPLVVDDAEVGTALLRQRSVRETLDAAAHADVGLVGVGAFVPSVSSLLRAGYMTEDDIGKVRATGVVGDVCGHFFTVGGALVEDDVARRIITIPVDALRGLPRVVGVAVGPEKVEAILGAARARLVNVLVTDDVTATAVLALAGDAAV